MKKKAASAKRASAPKPAFARYPRHSLEKVLRIPKAILDRNVGKECSDEDTATFLGIKYNKGPYALELSSALKFGLLEAVLKAPDVSAVYSHYRGENLPDMQFFDNALVDNFGIPKDKVADFKTIFFDTLNKASRSRNTTANSGCSTFRAMCPPRPDHPACRSSLGNSWRPTLGTRASS